MEISARRLRRQAILRDSSFFLGTLWLECRRVTHCNLLFVRSCLFRLSCLCLESSTEGTRKFAHYLLTIGGLDVRFPVCFRPATPSRFARFRCGVHRVQRLMRYPGDAHPRDLSAPSSVLFDHRPAVTRDGSASPPRSFRLPSRTTGAPPSSAAIPCAPGVSGTARSSSVHTPMPYR